MSAHTEKTDCTDVWLDRFYCTFTWKATIPRVSYINLGVKNFPTSIKKTFLQIVNITIYESQIVMIISVLFLMLRLC